VDSVNLLTNYGGVLEDHEINSGPYNNILSTTIIAGSPFIGGSSMRSKNAGGSTHKLPLR